MKTRIMIVLMTAWALNAQAQPHRISAPIAVVSAVSNDGGIQFFLVGSLPQGGTTQTTTAGGEVNSTSLPIGAVESGGGIPIAQFSSAATLGVVQIQVLDEAGGVVKNFSAGGWIITGYFSSAEYPNQLFTYGYFGPAKPVVVAVDFKSQSAPQPTPGNSLAESALHLTGVSGGLHLLTVCQDDAVLDGVTNCDTIQVRVFGGQEVAPPPRSRR